MITILQAAVKVREYRFTRQAALAWLATFPGDLQVDLFLARALLEEGRIGHASTILDNIITKDPEFLDVYLLMTDSRFQADTAKLESLRSSIAALGGPLSADHPVPVWTLGLRHAREALAAGDNEKAEEEIHRALLAEPSSPLTALLHVQTAHHKQDYLGVQNLANVYHTRWPECQAFSLYLAEARIKIGDETSSVALLHQCVAFDAAGQVPKRIWGEDHPYRPLGPDEMYVYFDVPIPAAVGARLGWNQLPEGEKKPGAVTPPVGTYTYADNASTPEPENGKAKKKKEKKGKSLFLPPEALRAIREEFERIARRLRKPGIGRADGRFPIYVVFSTRQGLANQYGPQTADCLDLEMNNLVEVIRKRPNWGAMVYYPDDPACTATYGLKAVQPQDPWALKLALADLDAALAKKGEMIGALLIVGSSQVVPFHRLPNPTDDFDPYVPSDNPYGTRDENYFVPEWPVSRLPGGVGSDAGLMLGFLRKMVSYHSRFIEEVPWWRRIQIRFSLKSVLSQAHSAFNRRLSFGYTAAIWKQSSLAVFKPIGDGSEMIVSPPVSSGNGYQILRPAHMGYFNLHGLPDSSDWYGQRELADPISNLDYPVAITPKDVLNGNRAPKVVFSEACYGAHIEDKTEETALSLKFLSSGTSAVVASTCVSYGSVTTPLIAADLFGNLFWKLVKDGLTAGEAFQQAKIQMVHEMTNRQGYLDGEDQKTLISFVLYGDPLVVMEEVARKNRPVLRPASSPSVKTICDRTEEGEEIPPVSEPMMMHVKKAVALYLPGLHDAEMSFSRPRMACAGHSHDCPTAHFKTAQSGAGSSQPKNPQRTVVTLKKQVQVATYTHRHYARMTMDPRGKMIKLSVSR